MRKVKGRGVNDIGHVSPRCRKEGAGTYQKNTKCESTQSRRAKTGTRDRLGKARENAK